MFTDAGGPLVVVAAGVADFELAVGFELTDGPADSVVWMVRFGLPIVAGDDAAGLHLSDQQLQFLHGVVVHVRRVKVDPVQGVVLQAGQEHQVVGDDDFGPTGLKRGAKAADRACQRVDRRLVSGGPLPCRTEQIPRIDDVQPGRLEPLDELGREMSFVNP